MSKRKPAAVKSWENILKSGESQKQIDAAERLMRQSWVLPMPVLPSNPWAELEGRWCEALVLGVFWNTGPGTIVRKIVVAIPDAAGEREEAAVEVVTNLYVSTCRWARGWRTRRRRSSSCGDPTWRFLGEETVRSHAPRRCFDYVLRGAPFLFINSLPAGGQVFPVVPEFDEFQKGVMVSLIEEAPGREGVYNLWPGEHLRGGEALLPLAAATTARRRPASLDKTENLFTGPPGGRRGARVVSAAGEWPSFAGARPNMMVRKDTQAIDPQPSVSELMAAIGALTDTVNSLSERGPPPEPAGACGASLLDPGRVPAPGLAGIRGSARTSVGVRGESAGATAYDRTLAAARRVLGEAAEGHISQEPAGVARGRTSEDALREQVAKGGAQGLQATQLAILEALERLQEGARGRGAGRHEALEDILAGLGNGSGESPLLAEDDADAGRASGSKGLGGLSRLQAALTKHPEKTSLLADQRGWRMLGSDVSNTPWSMALDGHIKFGKLESHQSMWDMLSAFHALARQQEWAQLGMRITQCLKAVEQSVQHGGSWRVAWLHSGLPDSRGNVMGNTGLAHPSELALAVQVLKDQTALENALKRTGQGGAGSEGLPGPEPRKTNKGKGKDKILKKRLRARPSQHKQATSEHGLRGLEQG
eukprot:6476555-Amphidinium_carterae.3